MAVRKRASLLVFVALIAAASFFCASASHLSRPHGLNNRKFLFESGERSPTRTFFSTVGAAQKSKSRPTQIHFSTLAAQQERETIPTDYNPPQPNPPIHIDPPADSSKVSIDTVNINRGGFNRGGAVLHNGVSVPRGPFTESSTFSDGEKVFCADGKHCPIPPPTAPLEEIVSKGPFEVMFPVQQGKEIFCTDGKQCPLSPPTAPFEEIVSKGPVQVMFPVREGVHINKGFNRGRAVVQNSVKSFCTGGKHCPLPPPTAPFEEIVSEGPVEVMFPVRQGDHINKGFNRGRAVVQNSVKWFCADGKHCPFPPPATQFEDIVSKGTFEEMLPVPEGDHINEGFNRGRAVVQNGVNVRREPSKLPFPDGQKRF